MGSKAATRRDEAKDTYSTKKKKKKKKKITCTWGGVSRKKQGFEERPKQFHGES